MKPSDWTADDIRRVNWLFALVLFPEDEQFDSYVALLESEYSIKFAVDDRERTEDQWDEIVDALDDWRTALRRELPGTAAEVALKRNNITVEYIGE